MIFWLIFLFFFWLSIFVIEGRIDGDLGGLEFTRARLYSFWAGVILASVLFGHTSQMVCYFYSIPMYY